jgi:hypothetical protein
VCREHGGRLRGLKPALHRASHRSCCPLRPSLLALPCLALPRTCACACAGGSIYQGLPELPEDMAYAPVTSLTPTSRYEKIVEAFGGKGYFVSDPSQLLGVLREALAQPVRTPLHCWRAVLTHC